MIYMDSMYQSLDSHTTSLCIDVPIASKPKAVLQLGQTIRVQHDYLDWMARYKVKVVVAGANVGIGVADEKVLDHWPCTLKSYFVEILVEFNINFSWGQI